MRCTRRNLIFACLVVLLIPAPASRAQQIGVGSIVGELRESRSDFPGRVFVELQLRGAPIASVYSDEQGKFGFYGLGSNPYHVVIHDERFYAVDQIVVLDTSVSPMTIVQISLNPRETPKSDLVLNRDRGSNPYLVDPSEYRQHFPRTAVKEFDKGVQADKNQKHDEAIRHYQKSISLAPDFYHAHNNLGSDYLNKSDFAAARKEYEEVVRINQTDAAAYYNLSNVCMLMGQFPQAQQYLDEGMRRQPESALGQFLLGSLSLRLGRPSQAEAALRHAIQLDPLMGQARLQLVNLLLRQGRKQDAVVQLHEFLDAFPAGSYSAQAKQVLQRLEAHTNPAPAVAN
jgi:tetratricopeptide (TPR) repeat protein